MNKARVLLVPLMALAGCTSDESAKTCVQRSDCAEGQICRGATVTQEGTCEAIDQGPASCQEDFDCNVGKTCVGATASQAGTCTAAAAEAERTFGQAEMSFANGSEAYLLAIYALPTEPSASSQVVSFSMSGLPAATRSVHKLLTARPAAASLDPTWPARLAYDSRRRAQMDDLVADLNAGRLSLARAVAKAPACGDCGDQMCWHGSCVTSVEAKFTKSTETVSLELLDVISEGGVTINVLYDSAESSAGTEAITAATEFAATLATELSYLGLSGHGGALDRDGDGRLTVAFTNHEVGPVTMDLAGLFDLGDFLPAGNTQATGNEADILWARIPGTSNAAGEITTALAVGTLVHEYTHLASYATRVQARDDAALRETLWLDEGLAHLMEDLCGWGGSNIATASVALTSFNDSTFASTEDSVAMRGKAFLLLRHLIDQKAKAAGATSSTAAATKEAARTFVSGLLTEAETGFWHPAFVEAGHDAVGQFLLGAYATGNSEVTAQGAHAFDYLPVGTTGEGQKVGIDTHAEYTDARGETVTLDGPNLPADIDDLSTADDLRDGTLSVSGNAVYIVTGGTGTVTLRGQGPAGVDLRVFAQRVR